MVENSDGGVTIVGGFTSETYHHGFIFRLRHAKTGWEEWPIQLKEPRDFHVAILVPDSYTNCSVVA